MFNSYLKPAYDTMMNTTKNRLHSTFANIFNSSVDKQIELMVCQLILTIVALVLALCILHSLTNKMESILKIPLEFDPCHI